MVFQTSVPCYCGLLLFFLLVVQLVICPLLTLIARLHSGLVILLQYFMLDPHLTLECFSHFQRFVDVVS